ncbi:unnamed protein product [Linum tenue]|uniref:S-adenosylmethionine-dependent methyltransferase At5g38100 n=1 Tax=Linum tenue TaxID=586396 RepID=A0AAV0J1B2_9ROSI|nr:unnamed protein product [Linum tenue]
MLMKELKNFIMQKNIVDTAKQAMQRAIEHELDLKSLFPLSATSSATFHIADFGCSIGPTTFMSVQNIIEAVNHNNNQASTTKLPLEFQVSFNDQTNNDFNTLFRSLPAHRHDNYFAAGVPGSFYGRLFPTSSLHLGSISSSLHWISRVPGELTAAGRRDSIQCTGLDEDVARAYSGQFTRDMEAFFDARAEELVSGGLLAISALCLPAGAVLAQTGLEEKLKSFYLPMYYPQAEELEASITKKRCFSIRKLVKMAPPSPEKSQKLIQTSASQIRAVSEAIIKQHFKTITPDSVDLIFERLKEKLAENMHAITSPTTLHHLEVFILAKRL